MSVAVMDVGKVRMEMAQRFMRVEMLVRAVAIPGEVVRVAMVFVMDVRMGMPQRLVLVFVRVVLPQSWPRLIDSLRLTLGSAWLFLIAAEAIASTEGLGYRIFLVRRYLAMDVILPYVVWITLLAFFMDWLLRKARTVASPWMEMGK